MRIESQTSDVVSQSRTTPAALQGARERTVNDLSDRATKSPVQVDLSKQARERLKRGDEAGDKATAKGSNPLDADEKEQVRKMAARDAEVRAHEAAHSAVAGGSGGAASFTFEQGPDGKRYAVGGEVPVQLQTGRTPEETIRNAQTVRAAALAPAEPSGQDRSVAAEAAVVEAKARQELAAKAKGEDQDGETTAKTRGPDGKDGSAKDKPESAALVSQLETERRQTYGSRGHEHPDGGCGFCSRAASRYAA